MVYTSHTEQHVVWHVGCVIEDIAGLLSGPEWVVSPIQSSPRDQVVTRLRIPNTGGVRMSWTKPEFEVVEVTMEVTAYVARR